MNIEIAKKKLQNFVTRDKERNIHGILVKDGCSYATDGRIAVCIKLDGHVEDDIPKEYPVDTMIGIIKEGVFDGKRYTVDHDQFMAQCKVLMEKRNAQVEEDRRNYRDRYEEVVCPDCRSSVYYDKELEKLVSEKEDFQYSELRNVDFPVYLMLDGNGFIFCNLGYVATIVREFGEGVMFWVNEKDTRNKSFFKTNDGISGVLMPLIMYGSLEDDKNPVKIQMHAVQEGE